MSAVWTEAEKRDFEAMVRGGVSRLRIGVRLKRSQRAIGEQMRRRGERQAA